MDALILTNLLSPSDKKYGLTFQKKYPKKNEVISKAVVARTLPKILELFKIISEFRRVPPGTVKDYLKWNNALYSTDEAGILMRVAQTSYITTADVIPNINGTKTYVIDSGMKFHSLKGMLDKLFVTNFEITVHIPYDEEIDIHCFETNVSVFTKWDTCFQLEKVGGGLYKVCMPGLHSISSNCMNRLKLIFTASIPKHLPINVLLEYDYVFMRYDLSNIVYDILKRYECVRVNKELAIKFIPNEPNRRPELFSVAPKNKTSNIDVYKLDKLFDKMKYEPDSEEESDNDIRETKRNILLKKIREAGKYCADIQPSVGNPDANFPAYLYGDVNISIPLDVGIILWCLQTIKPEDYDNLDTLVKGSKKEIEKIRTCISEEMEEDGFIDMDDKKYGILISHFQKIITERCDQYVKKYNKNDVKLFLSIVNKIKHVILLAGKDRQVPFVQIRKISMAILIKKAVTFNKQIQIVKSPENFWDISKFDVVYTETYNDDFGNIDIMEYNGHFT